MRKLLVCISFFPELMFDTANYAYLYHFLRVWEIALSSRERTQTHKRNNIDVLVQSAGNFHVYVTLSKALLIAMTLAAAPSNAALPVNVQNVQDVPQHQVFCASSYRKGSNHMITAADVFERSLQDSSQSQYGATESEWKFVPTFIGELRAGYECKHPHHKPNTHT